MYRSDTTNDLIAALAKAQGKMKPAAFNRTNPHFKTKYADLTSCMEACRQPLAEHSLAIYHHCETVNDKLMLVTTLHHTSDQWIKSFFPLNPANMTSQAIGSAMTYAKRYNLSCLLGMVSDDENDDDGEASQGRGVEKPLPKVSSTQISVIKKFEEKLDVECKEKLYSWLKSCFKVVCLEELPAQSFSKVFTQFENAVRFMESNKNLEVVNG
jgi:hypothetical protein